jgi:hypothetical protein
MTQVCCPTPFGRGRRDIRETCRHPQLLYRMVRLVNSVAVLPVALCQRTYRNAFFVENVQENWNHFLTCETWNRLFCEAPQCGLHPQV